MTTVSVDELALTGVRFWCGYRHPKFTEKRDGFNRLIASIFAPQTIQQMTPLGLLSYSLALVPECVESADLALPDEIALVVYPDSECYQNATHGSVAGRAYAALHGVAFNFDPQAETPASGSEVPSKWNGALEFEQCIALAYQPRCWQTHKLSVFLACRRKEVNHKEFRRDIEQSISEYLQETDTEKPFVSLLLVRRDWLLYWEQSDGENSSALITRLKQYTDRTVVDNVAKLVKVAPAFSSEDSGLQMTTGELLTLRL